MVCPVPGVSRPGSSNHVGISWERGEKDGASQRPQGDGCGGGALSRCYFKGHRVLPGTEDHLIRTFTMCSKMPGGVWDGVLGRGSSLGKGSGIRVQCVFDVATKRTHGLRWMGERRLILIWAVQGQLAPIWTPGCLPTQTSPQPRGFR